MPVSTLIQIVLMVLKYDKKQQNTISVIIYILMFNY
jgi:hypothetical protein